MLGLIESGRDAGAVMVPATGGPLNVFVDVPADYELPPVQSEHSNAIDLAGFEAIAWYVSFHVSKYGWGIYVAEDVLETYARRAFGGFTALSDREKLALGLQTVLDHELFHYWTDVACAQLEFAAETNICALHSKSPGFGIPLVSSRGSPREPSLLAQHCVT